MAAFAPKPTFRSASPRELMQGAMDTPFSPLKAFGDNFAQGALDSFGLGTAIRDFAIPQGNLGERLDAAGTPRPMFDPFGILESDQPSMTQEQFKASPNFREAIPFEAGMTEDRLSALADFYDTKQARARLSEGRGIESFLGGFVGQMFDPINYVGTFGVAARAAAVARFGSIGGRVLLSASEAAINTAAFGILTADIRRKFGDDVSFAAIANEVAMSALIGGVFGAGIGAFARKGDRQRAAINKVRDNLGTVANVQKAMVPLNDAVGTLTETGSVSLSPKGMAVVERMQTEAADRTAGLRNLRDETAGVTGSKAGEVVISPTGTRVAVRPEVVELSSLIRASGALQVRNRSSAASAAQVEQIATELDPARLMPSLSADQGAPLVGSDNIIDSGNGRVMAISRAYEAYPAKAEEYRAALAEAGYPVEGMAQPVLISRRTTPLSAEARAQFNAEANTSSTARMSAVEIAQMDRDALTDGVLDVLDDTGLQSPRNNAAVGRFLANLPPNERGALVDGEGRLNADGTRRMENALVAAAYGDVDAGVLRRFAEATDDNTRAIVGAMSDVAGQWARMRRAVRSGEVGPEFDTTPELTQALRLLGNWRDQAVSEKRAVSVVIREGLAQLDLLSGEISPEAQTFVRMFYANDHFAKAVGRDVLAGRLSKVVDSTIELGKPQLFGDALPVTKGEMLRNATDDLETDIFAPDRPIGRTQEGGQSGERYSPGPDSGGDRQGTQAGGRLSAEEIEARLDDQIPYASVEKAVADLADDPEYAALAAEWQRLTDEINAGTALGDQSLPILSGDEARTRMAERDPIAAEMKRRQEVAKTAARENNLLRADLRAELEATPVSDRQGVAAGGGGAKGILTTMRERFMGAGRDADEAEALGTMISEFYRTQAARLGRSVDALVDQFGLPEVRAGGTAAEGSMFQSAKYGDGEAFVDDFDLPNDLGAVTLNLDHVKGRTVEIVNIQVADGSRGSGLGSKAMNALVDAADENGIRLVLSAAEDADGSGGGLAYDDLVGWYESFGFEMTGGGSSRMQRMPADRGPALFQSAPAINTPEFKAWFKDSAVVDAEGKPLVVYHGTNADIEAFDPKLAGSRQGVKHGAATFFTTNPSVASSYPNFNFAIKDGEMVKDYHPGANVMPVYVKMENPAVWDMFGREFETEVVSKAIREAKRDGHDGVVFRNMKDEPTYFGMGARTSHIMAVFSPTQIKSTANRGTFDPADPRILFQVTPEQAREIDMPTEMPADPVFSEAVTNTPGAKITADGLLIDLVRYQKPEQEGSTAIRTGVFYLPAGDKNVKHYKGKTGYGGEIKVQGETLIRRPLFVKGATGGKAPEAAYDQIKGKGAYQKMRTDVLRAISDKRMLDERGYNLLEEYGADGNLIWEIAPVSKEGNTLAYALQENIVAHAVRDAGYDAVVGHSKGRGDKGAFISEIFDVREVDYPTPGERATLHPIFDRRLRQTKGGVRGAIQFGDDGRSLISLFEGADASTALHETGHHFLSMFKSMAERADAPAEMRGDWDLVRSWWGDNADAVAADSPSAVTAADVRAVLDTGTTGDRVKDLAINVGLQEQWARAFETYAREGVAPSEGLRGVFEQFKRWLTAIYAKAVDLNVNLSPEIRGVFDRLLTPEPRQTSMDLPRVSNDGPAPDPVPEGLAAAEGRVGKSEDMRALAEQHGVDLTTGDFVEQYDIDQMRADGRLTPEDEAAIKAADEDFAAAEAYGNSMKAALSCMI